MHKFATAGIQWTVSAEVSIKRDRVRYREQDQQ